MFLAQGYKGDNEPWRYIVGILLVFLGYFMGQVPLTVVQMIRMSQDRSIGTEALLEFSETMDFSIFGIDKNIGFLLLIVMFLFALVALYFVMTRLHNKLFKNFIRPLGAIQWNKIFFGFGLWVVLSIILELFSYYLDPSIYEFRFQLGSFLPLVLISFVFLPFQTSFEELFMRGYLMQGIAFFAKNKWIPILLSSILFGLIHSSNPEVAKFGYGVMMFYYITAGLFLAIITVLDDGLELALGVHAATNIFGATLFTYDGSVLQTDSLFILHDIKPLLMTFGFITSASIFIYICYKKYAWPALTSMLTDKVSPPESN